MKNSIYKGYIASRNIGELQIPQRIQNMVIRNYAERRDKVFSLSATEYIMNDCFMILQSLLKDAKNFEAIVCYSLYMLPTSLSERSKIYTSCLKENTELHFAFEELSIKSKDDIQLIEDTLLAKDLSQKTRNNTWPFKSL